MTALRRIPAAAWAALVGAVVTLWLFYPGFVSFDTAHQWYQVRHGEYSDHHPPLMAFLWSLTEPLLPGPGAPFLFQVLIWWAALAVIAAQLFRHASSQILAVLLVGFAPPLFVLLVHVWKDVTLMAWLLAVAAILVVERRRPARDRRLLVAAVVMLVGIAALRHNALAAVLPLTVYIVWRWNQRNNATRVSQIRLMLISTLAFVAIAILSQLPARHPAVERVQFWPTVALWDVAAVSIIEDRMLIPASLHVEPLTPSMLMEHFQPEVNVPLFASNLLRISLITPYSPAELAELRSVWLSLPVWHSRAYFHHRWRLARAQIGLPLDGMRPPQDLMADYTPFRDNPALQMPALPLRQQALTLLQSISGTPWLAAWPWLAASLPMALLLWRRRHRSPQAMLGLSLLASGWAYALPLTVLAASAELRYLSVTLVTIAVAALIVFSRASDMSDTARPDRHTTDSNGTGD